MSATADIQTIQRILGVVDDGIAGPKTEAAWIALKADAGMERMGFTPKPDTIPVNHPAYRAK